MSKAKKHYNYGYCIPSGNVSEFDSSAWVSTYCSSKENTDLEIDVNTLVKDDKLWIYLQTHGSNAMIFNHDAFYKAYPQGKTLHSIPMGKKYGMQWFYDNKVAA